MTRAFVGLGSNLGNRRAHIIRAVELMNPPLDPLAVAPLIETEALLASPDSKPQPAFLNTVVMLETDLSAEALLDALLAIEVKLNRVRTEKWGARTIDCDVLLFGDEVLSTSRLTVPHPELPRRRFVLEPLVALAPNLVHPVLQRTMSELLAALPAD